MPEAAIAFDIGGTKTAAAVIDRNLRVLDTLVAPTPATEGPDAIINTAARLASTLAARSGRNIRVVGVGTAGVVDVPEGRIVSSTDTLAGWAGTLVADRLRAALAPLIGAEGIVHVQNDVDAYAVGEVRHGAAAGACSALVVAVGTGVGAAVVIDGKPLRGARHVAGEIGHMPTSGAEHLRCPCGRFGHLEAIGSGVGMHRHYLSLGGDPAGGDARAVAALAANGNPLARRALQESAAAVGRAIAASVTLIDPECVVLTGGVAQIGALWWEPLERSLRAEVIDALDTLPVLPGTLGGDAPLIGAAISAWEATGIK